MYESGKAQLAVYSLTALLAYHYFSGFLLPHDVTYGRPLPLPLARVPFSTALRRSFLVCLHCVHATQAVLHVPIGNRDLP